MCEHWKVWYVKHAKHQNCTGKAGYPMLIYLFHRSHNRKICLTTRLSSIFIKICPVRSFNCKYEGFWSNGVFCNSRCSPGTLLMHARASLVHHTLNNYPASTKNVQRTFGGNFLAAFLWKIFLTFFEHLCGSFLHKHKRIFTDQLTSDYPNFAHHPHSCRQSLILYISVCFMFCCGMNTL